MTIPRLSAKDRMPDALRGGVVALGNFDGFHLGHQAVAGEAIAQAKASEEFAAVPSGNSHLKKAIAFMELAKEELEAAAPGVLPLTQ